MDKSNETICTVCKAEIASGIYYGRHMCDECYELVNLEIKKMTHGSNEENEEKIKRIDESNEKLLMWIQETGLLENFVPKKQSNLEILMLQMNDRFKKSK